VKVNHAQNSQVVLPERAKPKRCSLAATPEAFKILSDGLYGHKIRAVIRETSTNALDGNIAMKLNNPGYEGPAFYIHLPTELQPYYEARDFGIGLGFCVVDGDELETDLGNLKFGPALYSECEDYIAEQESAYGLTIIDEVTEMYTTYFHSNKIQSNDFIGCKGLGAKSPFAVCSAFTVTSIFNGEKRYYSAYLDGFPACVPMTDAEGNPVVEKTDEHPGLIVRVPVKDSQIEQYHSEAKKLYPYFKVKPVITYPKDFEIPEQEFVFEGKGWKMRDNGGRANAIMGSIAYPMSRYEAISDKAANVVAAPIDIEFNLGDLEIQPSREGLSYEQATIAALNARLEAVSDEILEVVGKEFDGCECLWDAKLKAHEDIFGIHGVLKKLASIVDMKSITWKGQSIADKEINIEKVREDYLIEAWKFAFHKRKKKYGIAKKPKNATKKSATCVKVNPKATFYEIDLPKGAYGRLNYQVQCCGAEPIYAMRFGSMQAKIAFADRVGIPVSRIKKASSLPEVPRTSSMSRYSNSSQVFVHTGRWGGKNLHSSWESVEIDLNEGGVYVPMCRYKVVDGEENLHPEFVKRVLDNLEDAGFKPIRVYGVRSKLVKQFEKSDDWVDLWTYVKNLLNIQSTKMDVKRHVANVTSLMRFDYRSGFRNMLNSHFNTCKFDFGTGAFADFINVFQTMQCSKDFIRCSYAYMGLMRIAEIDIVDSDCDLSKEFNKIRKIYPMLDYMIASQRSCFAQREDYQKDVADYVRMIDEKLEVEKMAKDMVDN
jgi:hypothetical protein